MKKITYSKISPSITNLIQGGPEKNAVRTIIVPLFSTVISLNHPVTSTE